MENALESRFNHGDSVKVTFEDPSRSFNAFVVGIHFYPGKVKYDLEIRFEDHKATRIYNVDSAFVD